MSTQVAIDYFKTQTALAKALAEETGENIRQGHVSYWVKAGLPADRCVDIERITNGEVTRAELRPDLFGDINPPSVNTPNG